MKMQKNEVNSSQVQIIVDFVSQCKGLGFLESGGEELVICQSADFKYLTLKTRMIDEVIRRMDNKKEVFLQINFLNGKKVILTDSLVGFEPFSCSDLDMNKLPKVVTTPDLLNFIEVLEESIFDTKVSPEDIKDVKQYFDSLLLGAENIGFNLICEKIWMLKLLNYNITCTRS